MATQDFAQPLAGLVNNQPVNVNVSAVRDVQVNGATVDGAVRSKLNLVAGRGVSLSGSDEAANDRVSVTVAMSQLIQAGQHNFGSNATSIVTASITFATAYSAAPNIATSWDDVTGGNDSGVFVLPIVRSPGTTGFTAVAAGIGGTSSWGGGINFNGIYMWQAVGS